MLKLWFIDVITRQNALVVIMCLRFLVTNLLKGVKINGAFPAFWWVAFPAECTRLYEQNIGANFVGHYSGNCQRMFYSRCLNLLVVYFYLSFIFGVLGLSWTHWFEKKEKYIISEGYGMYRTVFQSACYLGSNILYTARFNGTKTRKYHECETENENRNGPGV